MRFVALIIAFSVLLVQVDAVSANAVVNAPRVEQGYPQIQSIGFVGEWVAGLGISAGRLVAFAFVLTLLGFVVENGISNAWENREEYLSYLTNLKEDFTSWCAESKEWCSIKANDFDMWLDMVVQGTLDKSSDCWQAIKDYCVDLKNRIDNVNTSTDDGNVIKVEGVNEWLDAQLSSGISGKQYRSVKGKQLTQSFDYKYLANWGDSFYISEKTQLVSLKFINQNVLLAINPSWDATMESDFLSNCGFSSYTLDYAKDVYSFDGIDGIPAFSGMWAWGTAGGEVITDENVITYELDYSLYETLMPREIYVPVLLSLATGLVNGYDDWAIEIPKDDGITDEVAQGLTVAGGTSGVIERDGSLDNVDVVGVSGAKDDVVPIDWDNVSVEDLSEPYPYDDIKTVDLVDGVIVGTDTPIDEVVPPTDGADTPSDRNKYTLSGLTELFPFCIPFDLVMLFQTLKADAVAPCFKWKFVYYVDGEKKTEEIVLDLSKFNKVAEILRMMELLAFMIALTLKTRDLIRG